MRWHWYIFRTACSLKLESNPRSLDHEETALSTRIPPWPNQLELQTRQLIFWGCYFFKRPLTANNKKIGISSADLTTIRSRGDSAWHGTAKSLENNFTLNEKTFLKAYRPLKGVSGLGASSLMGDPWSGTSGADFSAQSGVLGSSTCAEGSKTWNKPLGIEN